LYRIIYLDSLWTMRWQMTCAWAVVLIAHACAPALQARPVRQGIWAARQVQALPIPTHGYQVYLVGELHGIDKNEEFELRYLSILHKEIGLQDVALEEKAVYEDQAQSFVDGRSDSLPKALCLRAGILTGIRHLNAGLRSGRRIRIHFTDVDSPASAIQNHLIALQAHIPGADGVIIPAESDIKFRGIEAVTSLAHFPSEPWIQSGLRTIGHSIRALQQGFEVGIGPPAGSPYLDDREQAVTENIVDLIRARPSEALLVLYGADHISRRMRNDGGPDRNLPFVPMALRLERSGVTQFSMVTFPLAGASWWRGQHSDLPWTPDDGHLASGESMQTLLDSVPKARFLYVDTTRTRVRLPSQDISNYVVDGFLLFPSAQPMRNYCTAP
jgi:hypothetical protein